MRTEKENTKLIKHVLRLSQTFHWKNWSGPMTPIKGISDILGIHRVPVQELLAQGIENAGLFLAIELKKEGWKPPIRGEKFYNNYIWQKRFIDEVNRDGGIGFFAQDVETVVEKLNLKMII